tara:strand:+ start:1404 stop:2558 length:1155 start_codon:yes stop_codon:yes gene_type:complete
MSAFPGLRFLLHAPAKFLAASKQARWTSAHFRDLSWNLEQLVLIYYMVHFVTTFPAAAEHLLRLLAVLPYGYHWGETLVESGGNFHDVLGPIVQASGAVLVAAGARSPAGMLLPVGAAAAAVFAHHVVCDVWPSVAADILRQLDPATMKPKPDTDLSGLFMSDVRRNKWYEWFTWTYFVAWASAGALLCVPSVPGAMYDWAERDLLGRWWLCEGKVITFREHWNSKFLVPSATHRHYSYIQASIKFGCNPCLLLPGGTAIGYVYISMWRRHRRKMCTWRVPASSLARPPPTAAVANPDPRSLWIDTTIAFNYSWSFTVMSTNIGLHEHINGARLPYPKAATLISEEMEDLAYAWMDMMMMGLEGSAPTAPIVAAPGQRMADLDF